jgi:hypothetical protein
LGEGGRGGRLCGGDGMETAGFGEEEYTWDGCGRSDSVGSMYVEELGRELCLSSHRTRLSHRVRQASTQD